MILEEVIRDIEARIEKLGGLYKTRCSTESERESWDRGYDDGRNDSESDEINFLSATLAKVLNLYENGEM